MGDNNFVTSLVSTNVTGLRFERAARQNERADPSACELTGQRVVGRSTEQNPNDLHSPAGRSRHADAVQHTTAAKRNVTHTSHTARSRSRTQYSSCRRVSLAFPEDEGGKNAAAYYTRRVPRGHVYARAYRAVVAPPHNHRVTTPTAAVETHVIVIIKIRRQHGDG